MAHKPTIDEPQAVNSSQGIHALPSTCCTRSPVTGSNTIPQLSLLNTTGAQLAVSMLYKLKFHSQSLLVDGSLSAIKLANTLVHNQNHQSH